MIMQLKTEITEGVFVYRPLDVFEDFEILYNHQYEDYKTLGGKNIPYTSKFKIPLTQNNRDLCTIPFDASYPLSHSVDGRMLYTDGTVAFSFICDIEGQTINVLQPYIDISIIDIISKAISDLSKWKMSDLYEGETINLTTDSWFFGLADDLGVGQDFIFPFYNFNNKNTLFAYDSKRGLCQLQPTFVVNKLLTKIFNYVGITINSDYLNNDNEVAAGIKANELGLMIPFDLKTQENQTLTTNMYFTGLGVEGNKSRVLADRQSGIPTVTATSTRLRTQDFLDNSSVNNGAVKFNYDFKSDIKWDGELGADVLGGRWCSTVDGVLKIVCTPNSVSEKPYFLIGKMYDSTGDVGDWTTVVNLPLTMPQLEVCVVDANMTREEAIEYEGSEFEWSQEYDYRQSQPVGVANYNYSDSVALGFIKYDVVFNSSSTLEFDIKANQDIELALIYRVPEITGVYNERLEMTSQNTGGTHIVDLKITDGYTEFEVVSSSTFQFDLLQDTQVTYWTIPQGASKLQCQWSISMLEHTTMPSGFVGGDVLSDGARDDVFIVDADIDLGESFKSVNDYKLLDVVKMIAQRFNLQFYSDSNGLIWIDSEENRKSGVGLHVDHLIDESMDVEFAYNENGILSVSDTSPSFYDDNYNRLDKWVVSNDKRDEVNFTYTSAVVNTKMFEDIYDDSGYELLKYRNDTNYWGTADRTQQVAKNLKPTFSFLSVSSAKVWFPFNECTYAEWITALSLESPPSPQYDVGFFNGFRWNTGVHPTTLMTATRYHSSTGFDLVAFEDGKNVLTENNLYRQTWYQTIMDTLNDESVTMMMDIYVSEDTFKILLDYPTILWKGQEWTFKGFNDFPLSAQNGGVCKITVIKKNVWN